MSAHSKTVFRDLGVLLHVPGVMALLSLPVCWLLGETYAVVPLVVTAGVSLVPGQILFWTFRGAASMRLRHAMVTTVLSWILIPVIGAIPFLLVSSVLASPGDISATVLDFGNGWNALFESISGFTSTGLTVAAAPGDLPGCLQWWRSFTQWVGGVGVILLALSVFHPKEDAQRLYFAEGHGDYLAPDLVSTVRTIWWIYLLYTGFSILLLRATGMSWWHAVNYGMAGIATGGFGVTDGSLADFQAGSQLAMVLVMILGAVSFATHYRILREGRVAEFWKDPQYRAFFSLLAGGALLLLLENRWASGAFLWMDSGFQWTAALATAGFSTVSLEGWTPAAHLLLSLAMVCGGVAGATTGGLKLNRVLLLTKGIYARVRGIAFHPWRLISHKPMADPEDQDGKRILEAAAVMAVLWVVSILAGTFVLLHAVGSEAALHQVLFEVASALGNVGLSAGISAPDLSWSGKLTLMLLMWLGRLEIVPVLVLIAAAAMGTRHARAQASASKGA